MMSAAGRRRNALTPKYAIANVRTSLTEIGGFLMKQTSAVVRTGRAVAVAVAMLAPFARTVPAVAAEPVGDPGYTVTTDPLTGHHTYWPVDLVAHAAVATTARLPAVPGTVDVYDEDVAALNGGGAVDDAAAAKTTAPFDYTFRFHYRLDSRRFYVTSSHVCIDNAATATPKDKRYPVDYEVTLRDDHGSYDVVVGRIDFEANVGQRGLCFDGIDKSNRYFVAFHSASNNDGDIAGTGDVDYS
jgi:hypothetical protein